MGETRNSHGTNGLNTMHIQKREPERDSRIPPRANFLAAANYMKNLFDGKKFNWAAMGGLALLCLGARRDMFEIQIVYEDRDFNRIKPKLEADQRIRMTETMNSLFTTKLLLATGPQFKDVGCTQSAEIVVYLIPPGSSGTPPNDVLRKNQVLLRLNLDGKMSNFKGLNMLYLVKTTIFSCKTQEIAKKDMIFLCQAYGKEIESVRHQLNAKEIKENFLGTIFFSRLSSEYQHVCYGVLLGKEPPPTMSITPPASQAGHRQTVSTSDSAARPRITSHKSSPSLSSNAQQTSAFLSLPSHAKPKHDSASAQSKPLSQKAVQPQQAAGNAAGRESRSRYRPISSAPTTSNSTRDPSPQPTPMNFSRPNSQSPNREPQQEQNRALHVPRPPGIQHESHTSKPHVVPGRASLQMDIHPAGSRPQKSMPNMKAAHGSKGPVPVFGHSATVNLNGNVHPQVAQDISMPTMSQRSSLEDRVMGTHQNHSRNSSPGRGPVLPSDQLHAKAHPAPSLQGPILLDKKEEHINNAPIISGHNASSAAGLMLVGPKQLYTDPVKPPTPPQLFHNAVVGLKENRYSPQMDSVPPTAFFAELEASPVTATVLPQPIIAELPAEMETPVSQQQVEIRHQTGLGMPSSYVQPANGPSTELLTMAGVQKPYTTTHTHIVSPETSPLMHGKQFAVSPVSPPANTEALAFVPQTLQTSRASTSTTSTTPIPVAARIQNPEAVVQVARPVTPRTQSAPLDVLPASLMIGGPGRRSPSNSTPFPPKPSTPAAQPSSNASKYQRYYSPSLSEQPTPPSQYKAYPGPSPSPPTAATDLPPPSAPYQQQTLPPTPPEIQSYPSSIRIGAIPAKKPQEPLKQTTIAYRINPLMAHPPTPGSPPKGFDADYIGKEEIFTTIPSAMSSQPSSYTAFAPPSSSEQYQHGNEPRYVPFGMQKQQQQHGVKPSSFEPGHQRSTSNDSTKSSDSQKLAMEYQLELPGFGQGYGNGSLEMSPPLRQVQYGKM